MSSPTTPPATTAPDAIPPGAVSSTVRTAALGRIDGAIERGCRHITAGIAADGNPGAGHCHYYRLPWALALAGRRSEAAAVMTWVERNVLLPNGDLRPGARTGFETRWSSYPLAIFASGAWNLERYDTANLLAERLRIYQDPETGGAYATHPDHRSGELHPARQDIFPTAQLGMTGLTTGHLDLAHGAYRWFQTLWDAQPALPTLLYSATNGPDLITDVAGDDHLAFQVVTDFTRPRQAFYNPGITAAFLGRYGMATGRRDAIALAQSYLDLTVAGTDAQFDHTDSVQVCKFAWGASVLLEATGETRYLEHALRMTDWFVDAQNADGSWDNSPFLMERAVDPASVRIEMTAEFVQHLTTLANGIGGHRHNESPSEGTT